MGHHNNTSSLLLPHFAIGFPPLQDTSMLEHRFIRREARYMFFRKDMDKLKSPEESSEVGKNINYDKNLKSIELFSQNK